VCVCVCVDTHQHVHAEKNVKQHSTHKCVSVLESLSCFRRRASSSPTCLSAQHGTNKHSASHSALQLAQKPWEKH